MFKWKDGRRRAPLPMDDVLWACLTAWKKHPVVIVEGSVETGSVLRIPQMLLAEDSGQIRVALPYKVAIREYGRRLCEELGCQPGRLVNWQVGIQQKDRAALRARVLLTTGESLLHLVCGELGYLSNGTTILDARTRMVPEDLLLGVFRESLERKQGAKVIILVAEGEGRRFSQFFQGAPLISVPQSRQVVRELPGMDLKSAVRSAIGRFLEGERPGIATEGGSLVVLLPNPDRIHAARRELVSEILRLGVGERVSVVSLLSEASDGDMNAAFRPIPAGTLRIICTTEMVCYGGLIPNVVGVLDSLLLLRRLCSEDGHEGPTRLLRKKRAEAEMAKALAGSSGAGFYQPLQAGVGLPDLSTESALRIHRESLALPALQAAAMFRSLRTMALPDRPPESHVDRAMDRLKRIGALDTEESITTPIGRVILRFPLEPELSRVLIEADRLQVLPEAIIVAAALVTKGPFQRGMRGLNQAKADRQRRAWAGERRSDFAAAVGAFRAFSQEVSREEPPEVIRGWCEERFLSHPQLLRMKMVVDRLSYQVNRSPLTRVNAYQERSFDGEALTKALLVGLPDHVYRRIGRRTYQGPHGNCLLGDRSVCAADEDLLLIGSWRGVSGPADRMDSGCVLVTDMAAPLSGHLVPAEAESSVSGWQPDVGVDDETSDEEEGSDPVETDRESLPMVPQIPTATLSSPEAPEVGPFVQRGDALELHGVPLVVKPRHGKPPFVSVPDALVESGGWKDLPDEGIRLSGSAGRAVIRVCVTNGTKRSEILEEDVRLLKTRVLSFLLFSRWTDRPTIPAPEFDHADAALPVPIVAEYGRDLSGEPLLAYGTVVVHEVPGRPPVFRAEWLLSRAKADSAYKRAVVVFERLQKELRNAHETYRSLRTGKKSSDVR